ncbi:hypothetical protein A1OE_484 [Candidatus Endolissoclinum faulkneri L2]|uniref:Uncharacterized protein n=1 Tax=Candidatus Endolissoclinum faulkneri L2 TaxID=1193729 RepID=K7YMD4_9PROT|nr:hypothetical protein A1OE_484 [Candidatus Endolissoclinum faulkneri L2]
MIWLLISRISLFFNLGVLNAIHLSLWHSVILCYSLFIRFYNSFFCYERDRFAY